MYYATEVLKILFVYDESFRSNSSKCPKNTHFFRGGIRPYVPVFTTFFAFGNSACIHAKDMVYPLIKSGWFIFSYFENPRGNLTECGPRFLMFNNVIFYIKFSSSNLVPHFLLDYIQHICRLKTCLTPCWNQNDPHVPRAT